VGKCTDSNKLERKINLNLKRVVQHLSLRETWIKGLTIKLKLPKLRLVAKSVLPYTLPNKMKFS
jgi:expansin (peptidoglycan-binding protein)